MLAVADLRDGNGVIGVTRHETEGEGRLLVGAFAVLAVL